ncbi:CPBP family intramembrane metalloprotease [Stackebrandtia albiflava]
MSVWRRVTHNRRVLTVLAVVVAALAAVSVANRLGPGHTGTVVEPVVALGLILLARRSGLTWHDLGLSRRTWWRGLKYALVAVAAVAVVYLVAVAVPVTRQAFLDGRYQLPAGAALLTALVFIPLGTILLEEVVFRGVLLGLLGRHRNGWLAVSISSVLFGLWHILPAAALGANRLVTVVLGSGPGARIVLIAGVVAFTGLAGWLLCELRRRSGSVIAAAGLHWATNGLGVLVTSLLWSARVV